MGRYAQLVIGPAGSGKSTYCNTMQKHFENIRRPSMMINLDPAAEKLHYQPTIDVRDLIMLDDVMEEVHLGPNGGLMFCMEYLMENLDWLEEEIGTEWEDEYIIIDCPGQIELYTHSNLMRQLITFLQSRMHIRVCVVYLLESQFIVDTSKFFSGVLTAVSAMIQLEVPHVSVLSKMDMIEGRPGEMQFLKKNSNENTENTKKQDGEAKPVEPVVMGAEDPDEPQQTIANTWSEEEEIERYKRRDMVQLDYYLDPAPRVLLDKINSSESFGGAKWRGLNEAIVNLLDDYDMVAFTPLNIHDEDSIESVLYNIDHALQFGEDQEPKENRHDGDHEDHGDNDTYEDIVERTWRSVL